MDKITDQFQPGLRTFSLTYYSRQNDSRGWESKEKAPRISHEGLKLSGSGTGIRTPV